MGCGGRRRRDPGVDRPTILSGDLAAAIGDLKARPWGELQVHGSGALVRRLLTHQRPPVPVL
jgi:hypothetical protein